MMSKHRRYFAQNSVCTATGHRAKHFSDLEEAKAWLARNGGGTVKDRATPMTINDPVLGPVMVPCAVVAEVKVAERDGEGGSV